jgi:hypothetical protein
MASALGVRLNFVAPNIGFRKNAPYADDQDLGGQVQQLHKVAKGFGVSLAFHAGIAKSADNFHVCGEATGGRLEVRTSGRCTYEMGVALATSRDARDQRLWRDWYAFTKKLAADSAFSANEIRRKSAREFITQSLESAGQDTTGIFEGAANLERALATLSPSPDHTFWLEYNFLFVLAAEGSTTRLGDHGPAGYQQRARFYGISDEGRLLFAKNVARYIIFLAESTGLCPAAPIKSARDRLDAIKTYAELVGDIG